MENGFNIRIELGIDAKRIMQQVQMDNKNIEDQIETGLNMALEEIANKGNFAELIKVATLAEVEKIVTRDVFSYQVKQKLQNLIWEKTEKKMNDYAEEIAKKITSKLDI